VFISIFLCLYAEKQIYVVFPKHLLVYLLYNFMLNKYTLLADADIL